VSTGPVPASVTRPERRWRQRADRARRRKRAGRALIVHRVHRSRHLERELCRLLT
jgi:hypothetical protein